MSGASEAPAIGDYGLIGDCHSAALVSVDGSIDWCCLPRFDSSSCFGRLLDRERGGFCTATVKEPIESQHARYLAGTLVLERVLHSSQGTVRAFDFFAMREHGALQPRRELIRILECERGTAEVRFEVAPRFDYGTVRPWLRRTASDAFTAIGGDDGLLVWSDGEIEVDREAVLVGGRIHAGEQMRLVIRFERPHLLAGERASLDGEQVDARLRDTVSWWHAWRKRLRHQAHDNGATVRSALTLKALTYAPTGAIVAAPT